ncbi:hypothetical protein B0O99DRAFT_98309 [Bisporella sp. PMI_857]|nr:hypothetical protein B0O99DRAFT_98309 [Bisporella sp. PMI_857]
MFEWKHGSSTSVKFRSEKEKQISLDFCSLLGASEGYLDVLSKIAAQQAWEQGTYVKQDAEEEPSAQQNSEMKIEFRGLADSETNKVGCSSASTTQPKASNFRGPPQGKIAASKRKAAEELARIQKREPLRIREEGGVCIQERELDLIQQRIVPITSTRAGIEAGLNPAYSADYQILLDFEYARILAEMQPQKTISTRDN